MGEGAEGVVQTGPAPLFYSEEETSAPRWSRFGSPGTSASIGASMSSALPGCGSRTGADMGSIESYETAKGRRYRALYRRPNKKQTQKRGFTTKKAAELFLATTEVDIVQGRYLDPWLARVTVADKGYQRIEPPKDYEHRSIPIPAFLVGLLRVQIAGRPADAPVFYGIRTGTWLRNHVYRVGWFDDAAAAVGLKGLTPHELRHTAASLAVSAGANVKAVQRMLGHASAAVTLDVYADLFDDDLDSVATALDRAAMQSDVANLLPKAA